MKLIYKFITFCIVGGISFLVDIGFFNLFYWLGAPFAVSRISSIIIAIIFNFIINRNYVFSAKKGNLKAQIPKYIVVYVLSNLVNFIVSIILNHYLGEGTLNANIASMIGVASSIPVSFLGSLLWAFKKK